MKIGIPKYFKYQNFWYATKATFRGEFIAIDAYIKLWERPQINNSNFYLKKLGKEEKETHFKLAE